MRAYFGILEAFFKDILCKSHNSKLYTFKILAIKEADFY